MFDIPRPIKTVLYMLEKSGYEAYIVGGCVRDALMNKTPHDFDVTTSALPNEVEEVFSEYKVIATGLKHGTVTVVVEGFPIEITTFRVEGEYLDGRRPSIVNFTRSLKEDAARRDFTINAMAVDVRGEVFDFYGGQEDLVAKVIRAVGNPKERFTEDALRIMRALRFASVTGFEIEKETEAAIRECKEMLLKISAERIREELIKLLCGHNVKEVIMKYWDVLAVVIPEIEAMHGFEQKSKWHIYDVLEHTAVAVSNIPAVPTLRLTAFFHDFGKPHCFTSDEAGCGHFYGHALISVDMTRNIMNRLKFDNETKAQVLQLVKHHDLIIEPTPKSVKRALNKFAQEGFAKLIEMKRADNLAQNPEIAIRQATFDELEAIAEEIIAEEQCFSLKDLALNGSDLIAEGFEPGKEIGRILAEILEAVIEERLPNDKAELLKFAQKIKK